MNASADPNGNGLTWGTAHRFLKDALSVAASGDIVWVAAGEYRADQDELDPTGGDRGATFLVAEGVSLLGGFAGNETDPDEAEPYTNLTILTGDLLGNDGTVNPKDTETTVFDDNTYHIITLNGYGVTINPSNTLIKGFIITRADATDDDSEIPDPDVDLETCDPCICLANRGASGGGMRLLWASPRIEDCRFIDNRARWGGGINAEFDSSPMVVNCEFDRNVAIGNGNGGAFNIRCGSVPTIVNCKFSRNYSTHVGGAVAGRYDDFSDTDIIRITNCWFVGNVSTGLGGAMRAGVQTSWQITSCTFVGNQAIWGGGIAVGADSPIATARQVQLRNCIVYGNTATGSGGIYGHQIALTGVFPTAGSLEAQHCDIQGSSTLPNANFFVECQPGFPFDCFELTLGDGMLDANPNFVLDPDPGSGGWGDGDDDLGDLRLTCGSQCVDTGDAAALPPDVADLNENSNDTEPTPLDLDLEDRVFGADSDMGAYEVTSIPYCQSDATGNGLVDVDDLLEVINGWGTCPSPPASCVGDVGPAPCGGNGEVDVDDLLMIINQWGHDCSTQTTVNVGSLSSVQDCMDAASLRFTPFSPQWDYFVNRCIDALCAQEIIECDH